MKLLDVVCDMDKRGIKLFFYNINGTDAATLEMNEKYAVFLDPVCFASMLKLKDALMHEEGHCATGCTHKLSSSLDLIEKHEHTANRWAIERYLPFNELNRAVMNGYTEIWDLADYFDVSEDFIKKAIKYYTESRGFKFG